MLLGSPGQVHDLWGGEVEALNSFRGCEDVGHFWRHQTSKAPPNRDRDGRILGRMPGAVLGIATYSAFGAIEEF